MFALINKKDDWAKVDEYMHKMNLDGLLDQKLMNYPEVKDNVLL